MVRTDFMTSSSPNHSANRPKLRGFTLVEVMIAAAISTIILMGVLASFLMIVRSGVRASHYSVMEAETRRAFEQLGIDARMASDFTANFTSGVITSFTLTIPNNDLSAVYYVTWGYDTSDPTNKRIYCVPGNDPTATAGRQDLVNKVDDMRFFRYDTASALITDTSGSPGIKHIQISVSVKRTSIGVAAATQIIRSSAFTLRNISI
jgi:prepilin-type N-terminal cleavage/methylation domain-containing protein